MGLRVVFVMRMINATDVIQENVQIKIGAKTENALWRRTFLIAMNVPKNVKRDFCLIKPYGFTLFIKRHGADVLMECLEQNEKNGIIYHREGIVGDYDEFNDVEKLINFIKTGKR